MCLSEQDEIVAFYSLKHIIVNVKGASSKIRSTAEAGADGESTGILLAWMGVRSGQQGAGIGNRLVKEAMQTVAKLDHGAAFRLLIVDAENPSLVPFYEKHGFRPLAGDLRLVMKISAVHKIVDAYT